MADTKVSALPVLTAGGLDPVNDFIMVGDASVGQSKRMAPVEMIRAAIPFLSSFYDFTTGVLPAGVAFTRASTGWCYNSSGVLVPETMNVPRFQYDPVTFAPQGLLCEAAVTNAIRNNTMVGAVAGTPGTPPTHWTATGNGNGLTRQIVGQGTEDGIDYIDVKYSGTSSASSVMEIYPQDWPQTPAAAGQIWTGGFFLRLVAGSWANVSANIALVVFDSGGAYIDQSGKPISPASGPLKTQFTSWTYAPTNGAVAFIRESLVFFYSAGVTIDFTLRIGLPQLAQTSEITTPIKTSGSAVARAEDFVLITNPQALADQCYIVRGRTPIMSPSSLSAMVFQVDDGTYNNRRSIAYYAGRMYAIAVVGGVGQVTLDLGAVANNTDFVIAARFADNNFAASMNGGAVVTNTSGANPLGLTTARLGSAGGADPWNSTIRKIETRRTATDAELPLLAA